MEYLYMLNGDGFEWEDMLLYMTEEHAMSASLRYPHRRVEIFQRDSHGTYSPTYDYWENGKLVKASTK
jgi:hypothetical protein